MFYRLVCLLWKIIGYREARNRVAFRFVSITVQVSNATTCGRGILKIEPFQILVDFDDVMLIARLGTDNISSLHIEGLTFCHNFVLATENQPVLVAVVVMAVETAVCRRDTEHASIGYAAPLWPIVLSHFFLTGSNYWHVDSSTVAIRRKRLPG